VLVLSPNATLETVSVVLAALYLRGLGRPSGLRRSAWPAVEGALRRRACRLDSAADALRADGLWAEAAALDQDGLIARAHELVRSGQCLTAADAAYPRSWHSFAPPAVWLIGALPSGPLLGVVGSRRICSEASAFAADVAREGVRLGMSLVTGGAVGADMAAAGAVPGASLLVLPHGLGSYKGTLAAVSACAPGDLFSTAHAMERNALIYAASGATVVAHARFREGGTWHGATDALRRRLCPLIARDDGTQAARALFALGATPLQDPSQLAQALQPSRSQGHLF
jgi:predicted Rossmann fold nucleotide-binding protein DprA/Smf involved in DNA uptake